MRPIDGIRFSYNDFVHIKSGDYAGNDANVISLDSIEPIAYLVELDGARGGDVVIAETDLEMN